MQANQKPPQTATGKKSTKGAQGKATNSEKASKSGSKKQGAAKQSGGRKPPPVKELHPADMQALRNANPRESPENRTSNDLEYA